MTVLELLAQIRSHAPLARIRRREQRVRAEAVHGLRSGDADGSRGQARVHQPTRLVGDIEYCALYGFGFATERQIMSTHM